VDWLVVSNIALWIGFAVMVVINLALARQIGVLYERVAPAGALMVNQNLEVGSPAPDLSVMTIRNELVTVGKPEAHRSHLLFFLSPSCPICDRLLPVLKSTAQAERDWLDVTLASDGAEQDHLGFIAEKGLGQFPYVLSELLGKTYGVGKLPYAVLIDEEGLVASMGIVNSREHLESLFEAKEQKVASMQEYLQQRAQPERTRSSDAGARDDSTNTTLSEERTT
jgi:methylamine dehydrogenase accessory protein MauD